MGEKDNQAPTIVWFREDLRLGDNPALDAAVQTGSPIILLFILDNETEGLRQLGGAARWWLHHSLSRLSAAITERGGALVLRLGEAGNVLRDILAESGAKRIVWNRRYGAAEIQLDASLKSDFQSQGIEVESFNGRLLHEPWEVKTKSGNPFKVFTPFWKTCLAKGNPPKPDEAPGSLTAAACDLPSDDMESWELTPTRPNWARGFSETWEPGETGAQRRLAEFVSGHIADYASRRDEPATDITSRLSPHLAFGEISPRQIWWAVQFPDAENVDDDVRKFLSEIGWREFAYHLLFYNQDLATANFQSAFDAVEWAAPGAELHAWKTGQTGYPIVDAAMRQLWQTGWMHNRCRLIVGSFLVKHLLIDWRHGEEWFWDTLVDADQANNPAGWQWIAGTGADAAPYFRIFNPILQSRKFDPDGEFIRAFCPELAGLDDKQIHEPWTAPADILTSAGVILGKTYPKPIVEHKYARQRALAAFKKAKNTA